MVVEGTIRWMHFKATPSINDICRQLAKELKAIKDALEMGFEYLHHPLAYKHVKVQLVVILKTKWRSLKRMMLKGELHTWNCQEDHWNQLKKVLMKDENKRRVIQMKGIRTTQKNASWVGQVGVEKWMVHFTLFLLLLFFLLFLLLKFWMCMHLCVLGNRSWKGS